MVEKVFKINGCLVRIKFIINIDFFLSRTRFSCPVCLFLVCSKQTTCSGDDASFFVFQNSCSQSVNQLSLECVVKFFCWSDGLFTLFVSLFWFYSQMEQQHLLVKVSSETPNHCLCVCICTYGFSAGLSLYQGSLGSFQETADIFAEITNLALILAKMLLWSLFKMQIYFCPGSSPGGDSQFFLQTFPVCVFPSNQ